jgi:hypothetical protein
MLKAASPECVIAILVGSTWKYKGGSWALTGEGTNDEKVETARLTHFSTDAPVNYGSRQGLASLYISGLRQKRVRGSKRRTWTCRMMAEETACTEGNVNECIHA